MKKFLNYLGFRFKLPEEPPILWRGNCRLCNKELHSIELSEIERPICLSCCCGYTKEGMAEIERLKGERERIREEEKRQREDRRQINLYKRAILEIEQEKNKENSY